MRVTRRLARGVSTALALAVSCSILLVASPAAAHETREVGPYTFVVGFGTEPAFAGYPNSAEVTITRTRNEQPVIEGVELELEVSFGETTTTYEVEPNFLAGVFGEPGNYGADFIPTRPGQYAFRFVGSVEGTDVDETFTSGPETFSDANDPADQAFPQADPPVYEVADRVSAESERVSAAEERADSANTLALVALIVAILAIVVAVIIAVVSRRRPA